MESSNILSISIEESKHPLYDQYKNPNPMKLYYFGVHRIEIEERYEIKDTSKTNFFDIKSEFTITKSR